MKKTLLNLLFLLVLATTQANGQASKTATFKHNKFSIEYPAQWKMTKEDEDGIQFSPIEDYGAMIVTYDADIDVPLASTRDLLLEAYNIKDKPENIKMKRNGDVTEFYYEYIDNNMKSIIKGFRKKTDLYLIVINCELNKWDTNKDTFLKAMNSFKLN